MVAETVHFAGSGFDLLGILVCRHSCWCGRIIRRRFQKLGQKGPSRFQDSTVRLVLFSIIRDSGKSTRRRRDYSTGLIILSGIDPVMAAVVGRRCPIHMISLSSVSLEVCGSRQGEESLESFWRS